MSVSGAIKTWAKTVWRETAASRQEMVKVFMAEKGLDGGQRRWKMARAEGGGGERVKEGKGSWKGLEGGVAGGGGWGLWKRRGE